MSENGTEIVAVYDTEMKAETTAWRCGTHVVDHDDRFAFFLDRVADEPDGSLQISVGSFPILRADVVRFEDPLDLRMRGTCL